MTDQIAPPKRRAEPGERCTCGQPAVTVYETEEHGDVGYCGFPDGGRSLLGSPNELRP